MTSLGHNEGRINPKLCRTLGWANVHLSSWWRHQMETFSVLLVLCEGNSQVTSEFPSQRPVTWSFDVFFDLRLNKQLSKQWKRRWFEMPSHPLWCHCNVSPPSTTCGSDKTWASWHLKSGPLFTEKKPSYQYRDSHYNPETVVTPS